tara:strand:- start:2950 stop:3102 length:153 start_codon:yes stop_codon:yes gene_type:complete
MSKFKFTTKSGTKVSACETDTTEKAWEWVAATKQLTIKQAKDLYNITKIN